MSIFNQNNSQNDQDNSADEAYSSIKRSRNSSIIIFIVIIVGYFIYSTVANSTSCGGETTTGRVKLTEAQCNLILTEPLGKWYDKVTEFTPDETPEGMSTFYMSTGVQPIITIIDEGTELTQEELNAKAEEYYKTGLFQSFLGEQHVIEGLADEGHMIVAFQPSNGAAGIYSGTDARTVMDADAVAKFRDILQKNYRNKKPEQVMDKAFNEASGKIMGRTMSSLYLIIILGVACVGYLVYGFIKVKKQQQGRQN